MELNGRNLIIDCKNYKDICHAPVMFNRNDFDMATFRMEKIKWIQCDELTHLRCIIEKATSNGLSAQVYPPLHSQTRHYSEGMGLLKGFDLPGTPFPNGRTSTYIPLTRINSDRNEFLYDEFLKIFEQMKLSATVIPSLCLALTEIADNIFYHSGYQDNQGWGYLAAQVYKNRVAISFTDVGTGFERAYERSGTKKDRANIQLLQDSLNYMESRFNIPGQKATRGIGLHEASNLARSTGGRLVLRSGNGMISLTGRAPIQAQQTSWIFCGSQVSMEVPI